MSLYQIGVFDADGADRLGWGREEHREHFYIKEKKNRSVMDLFFLRVFECVDLLHDA